MKGKPRAFAFSLIPHPSSLIPTNMRIAILGTRGIPASYGGFETFAEELSKRLVARGHDITVYCRSHYVDRSLKEHNGVRLSVLPTLRHKYLETVIHSLLSMVHAVPRRFDCV